jgi:dGTPase
MPTRKSTRALLYRASDYARCVQIPARPEIDAYRSAFRRDYARLIHSPSFRRLQGKTQLFPGTETDFFRNRLTHSLEVAQVAKSIALKLNAQCPELRAQPEEQRINCDVIEFAGLAHDIGHAPFGHNGEHALNECMKNAGGFEGNAQSLRIVARLEKRLERATPRKEAVLKDGVDVRVGLNLTYRTLASILKYDNEIPLESDATLAKGYYLSETELVGRIKSAVAGEHRRGLKDGDFKTIECQIMDVADDIAYSTYDLEDAFKAEFLSPLRLLSKITREDGVLTDVLKKVNKNLAKEGIKEIDHRGLLSRVLKVFARVFEGGKATVLKEALGQTSRLARQIDKMAKTADPNSLVTSVLSTVFGDGGDFPIDSPVLDIYHSSNGLAVDGYFRSHFTSSLVSSAVEGVEIKYNAECPALSVVSLNEETRIRVEILKHLTYELIIMSSRLKVVEHRGSDIVGAIFEALSRRGGEKLLPSDYRAVHSKIHGIENKKRAICDFIACMTDRYALEFYRRLTEAGESIFKPV